MSRLLSDQERQDLLDGKGLGKAPEKQSYARLSDFLREHSLENALTPEELKYQLSPKHIAELNMGPAIQGKHTPGEFLECLRDQFCSQMPVYDGINISNIARVCMDWREKLYDMLTLAIDSEKAANSPAPEVATLAQRFTADEATEMSVIPADVDPLEWILKKVTEAWHDGADSINLQGLRCINPGLKSELPAAIAALQQQGGSVHTHGSSIDLIRDNQKLLEALRKDPHATMNADILINQLENAAVINLLNRRDLYELLLLQPHVLELQGKNALVIKGGSTLYDKLSKAYWEIQGHYNLPGTKAPCDLPPSIERVLLHYALSEPMWQQGPGCYGAKFKGDKLIEQGVSPMEALSLQGSNHQK